MKKNKSKPRSDKQENPQHLIFNENVEEKVIDFSKSNICVLHKSECQSYILFRIEDYILFQASPCERESFLKYCKKRGLTTIEHVKDYDIELNQISLEWAKKTNTSLIEILESIDYLDYPAIEELLVDVGGIIQNEINGNTEEYFDYVYEAGINIGF